MDPCKYEEKIGGIIKANENFEEFMKEMRENHLKHIYDKLEDIVIKMSSRRPTWGVLWIISSLTTLCGILTTIVLKN